MRGSFGCCLACHERIGADKQLGPHSHCLGLKADSFVNNERWLFEGGCDKQGLLRRLQLACIAFGSAFVCGQSRQQQAQSRRLLVHGLIDAQVRNSVRSGNLPRTMLFYLKGNIGFPVAPCGGAYCCYCWSACCRILYVRLR